MSRTIRYNIVLEGKNYLIGSAEARHPNLVACSGIQGVLERLVLLGLSKETALLVGRQLHNEGFAQVPITR